MGTARGNTQGSWRPPAARVVSLPPEVTVFCSVRIVAVGLKAIRRLIDSPTSFDANTARMRATTYLDPTKPWSARRRNVLGLGLDDVELAPREAATDGGCRSRGGDANPLGR